MIDVGFLPIHDTTAFSRFFHSSRGDLETWIKLREHISFHGAEELFNLFMEHPRAP